MSLHDRLAVARGDRAADLLFRGGRVVNVLSGEIEAVDVAVHDGLVVGLGAGYEGSELVEVGGRYLLPGFIDAHVHIESSLLTPPEFARAVVPRGTVTVIADPHEIANVHGVEGIRFMLDASEGLPLTVMLMAPSCVPATPMSTGGATLTAESLAALTTHPRVLGLGEVMNFPGVIEGDDEVLAKIQAYAGRPIDGHAPGVRGAALNAYLVGGPRSDHESTTAEEALEKVRRGLFVLLREATNARNLTDLLPSITSSNRRRFGLCTDDRQPPDLLDEGGIDAMLRTLISAGLPPVEAVRMATLNPAEHYGLTNRGALAPGRRADIVVTRDLTTLSVDEVWVGGRRVAEGGQALPWAVEGVEPPPPSMRVDVERIDFSIAAGAGSIRVIVLEPDQLVTASEVAEPKVSGGWAVSDPERDIVKIAVVERHRGSGRVGLGFVRGMGLREGAIAGTVAHDHHNLIVMGVDDTSMAAATRAVVEMGGGLAAARENRVLATLALPVGGLMSAQPIERVRKELEQVIEAARELGSPLHDPFMAMSFLGLEVIPTLKITDMGLVDVDNFRPVSLWV